MEFPFICLLVSGGHTMLVLARRLGQYEVLGNTLDDSVGEAFDKVARMIDIRWTQMGRSKPGTSIPATIEFPHNGVRLCMM